MFKIAHLLWVSFIEQHLEIPLRRQCKEFIGVDHCPPQIAETVEGDAVGPRAPPQIGRAKCFSFSQRSIVPHTESADASTRWFRDVEILFPCVHADFVGKVKAFSDDAELAIDIPSNVAVSKIRTKRMHPILDLC